jgi:Asp-tRNA(Asn)/Glu-tRNA(Gln) amidotransferase B subunit
VGLLLVGVGGCASSKTLSRNELESEIKQASSLAAESELFVDLRLKEQTTRHFSTEHRDYLQHKAEEMLKDFSRVHPDPDIAGQFHTLQSAVKSLADSIGELQSDDPEKLHKLDAEFKRELRDLHTLSASLPQP